MQHSASIIRTNPERHFNFSPTQQRRAPPTDVYSLLQQEKQRSAQLEKQIQKLNHEIHTLKSRNVDSDNLLEIRKKLEAEITQWKQELDHQLAGQSLSDIDTVAAAQQYCNLTAASFGRGVESVMSLIKVHRDELTQAVRGRLEALEQLRVCDYPVIKCRVIYLLQ